MLQVIPEAFVPVPHPKPVREVRFDIEGFPEILALRDEVKRLRAKLNIDQIEFVGETKSIRQLKTQVIKVAASDVPVLILGETGTGKEKIAYAIHQGSSRKHAPFIAENCGAFAEGLLASELFGHEAGAFTGATKTRRGLFEQAHGGTLFLDEVGDMDLRVQAHLLRVLQEGTLRRVGAETSIKTDVRLIAATNRDLAAMVQEKRFREDLYYRLRGITIEIPPLRERQGDIPLLVRHFLKEFDQDKNLYVTQKALYALQQHAWPGNVRELRAEVSRWPIFFSKKVDDKDLSLDAPKAITPSKPITKTKIAPLSDIVLSAEIKAISEALATFGHNISQTARALKIDRNTLKRKMMRYNLK